MTFQQLAKRRKELAMCPKRKGKSFESTTTAAGALQQCFTSRLKFVGSKELKSRYCHFTDFSTFSGGAVPSKELSFAV